MVLDTETRSLTPAAAERTIHRLGAQVDLSRPGVLALRIDSTLRGNWGAETAALLAGRAAPDLVVITPAYPEAGRRCVDGQVTVGGRPLAEAVSGLPGAPTSSSVIEILFPQLQVGPAPITLPVIRQGAAALVARLAGLHRVGTRVVICDAAEELDVEVIAAALSQLRLRVLSVDPGPVLSRLVPNGAPARGDAVAGPPALIYAGTQSVLSAAELDELRSDREVGWIELAPGDLARRSEAPLRAAVEQIKAALLRHDLVVARTTPTDWAPQWQRAIDRSYGLIARRVQLTAERPPQGLILTGGATALAVARGLGAQGVLVERLVRPLVARGQLVGGSASGLAVVTKGGLVPGLAEAIADLLGA